MVVVGIPLGLQADGWSEARRFRHQADLALALVEMIDIQRDSLGTSRRAIQLLDRALVLLRDNTASR